MAGGGSTPVMAIRVKDNFKHNMCFVTLAKYLTDSETLFSKDAPISLYSKLKKSVHCMPVPS